MASIAKMIPLTGDQIRPHGWLKKQLRLQADGLAGNLDKIWPDVRDSKWIGGKQEGWERVPYWLDGFIPLAYLLDDADLKARARRYIDGILERQAEDGWICPCEEHERANYDTWAALLITKVLCQYAEYSGDERIENALYRCFRQLDGFIDFSTLRTWGAARWYEGLIGLQWLYNRRPEPWMEKLAAKLRFQGFDYEEIFKTFVPAPPQRHWDLQTHVVNLAMSLKQEALYNRFIQKPVGDFAKRALTALQTHHGQASGHFTGDECLSGTSPIQGTELCGVVEAMYSYEHLLAIDGDPFWGDQLERTAFNSLPATCSADMWTHQYDQQTNQVRCALLPVDHIVFRTNGPDAHRFGLEPNFGCCTANMGQGWPKLAASAFMQKENGLALSVLLPVSVETTIQDVSVKISVETEYPFRDTLSLHVTAAAPVSFPLFVRIPGFASKAEIDGKETQTGAFARIDRTWQGTQTLRLSLSFRQEILKRPNGLYCLRRGPLLFAMPVAEEWIRKERPDAAPPRIFPYCDYDIVPKEAWGYGFTQGEGELVYHPLPEMPFDTDAPAVEIRMPLAPLAWKEENGVARLLPESTLPLSAPIVRRLIPYGCTQLRLTEMPLIQE